MSGFESDLREKILGSNAHIQVTREEGETTQCALDGRHGSHLERAFRAWSRRRRTRQSEVVIASNNNGLNVII